MMHLKPYDEIIGVLTDVHSNNEMLTLHFSIKSRIDIPKESIKEKEIKKLIGKHIGIMNSGNKYNIRKIKEKNENLYQLPDMKWVIEISIKKIMRTEYE